MTNHECTAIFFLFYIHTKVPASQWELPEEQKAKKSSQVRSNVKVLLSFVFDSNDVVHHEFSPQGRMANRGYYLEGIRRLREGIRQKPTELGRNQSSMLVQELLLAKNKTVIMPQ